MRSFNIFLDIGFLSILIYIHIDIRSSFYLAFLFMKILFSRFSYSSSIIFSFHEDSFYEDFGFIASIYINFVFFMIRI